MNSSLRERLSGLSRRRAESSGAGLEPVTVNPAVFTESQTSTRSLETMLSGVEVSTASGRCFRHERGLHQLSGADSGLPDRLARRLEGPLPEDLVCDPAVRLWRDLGFGSAAFLDLETTGLGAGPIILAGILAPYDGAFRFRLYLARSYAEETALIEALCLELTDHPIVITYNGKSYDLPFLRERRGRLRARGDEPRAVLDVLHPARRRWKGRFPDLKLSTLERYVCGRRRYGDIPGRDIPAVYHRFVRNGNPASLIPILLHNLADLYTLCEVTERVLSTPVNRDD